MKKIMNSILMLCLLGCTYSENRKMPDTPKGDAEIQAGVSNDGSETQEKPLDEDLKLLSESQDQFVLRDAAQKLGDRHIKGELQLDDTETKKLNDAVQRYMEDAKSDDPDIRSEARQQIERLWGLATPILLDKLSAGGTA